MATNASVTATPVEKVLLVSLAIVVSCSLRPGRDVRQVTLPQQLVQREQIPCTKCVELRLAGRKAFLEQLLHFQLLVGRLEVAARQLAGQVRELPRELGSPTRSHLQFDEILLDR